jgi:predicted DsbA family dithiol-disulfide isomerase
MTEPSTTDVATVKMWADLTCPWSYLSLGRFAEAVRRYHAKGGTRQIAVEFHSFELSPDTPVDFDGSEVDFLVQHRGIDADEARNTLATLTGVASAEGLYFDFARVRHTNSRLAHQLVHHATTKGLQEAMVQRLMRAYFSEGRHLGRVVELVDLAAEVGLHPVETDQVLTDGTYADAVAADIEAAAFFRIRALPFLLIGPRYGVSGPHDPGYYAEVLLKTTEADEG